MKRRLRASSPALVIALIALFVALGGTSYAAINALPKKSVGTKQLKNNAVTGVKIKNGAVTAAKINATGLTVPSATHATSADSATNATNATNAANATAAASLTGVQWVESGTVTNGAMSQTSENLQCPAGTFVVGGGAFGSSGTTNQAINSSYPIKLASSTVPNAWHIDMNNADASSHTFIVYAICIKATGTSF